MIISRTPFRISFFGGGTDFPEFYREHGGAVLCTTINQYCYINIHRLAPFFTYRFKASYAHTEAVQEPAAFQHPLIRECLLMMNVRDGMEISHVADLPGRTGLGSSSAFTVGLLNALHALRGDRVTPEDLAREAIVVERERVGDAGGHQDQYAAAYGGLCRIDFNAQHPPAVRLLPVGAERLRAMEEHFMLLYLGREQSAGDILSEQKQRTPQNVTALKEMLAMVGEAEAIISGPGDINALGCLLDESWRRKKSLAKGISNDAIDAAYAAARKAGALGGKLLGAGGRGFLLLFAEQDRQGAIRKALPELQEVTFRFSYGGSQIIFNNP